MLTMSLFVFLLCFGNMPVAYTEPAPERCMSAPFLDSLRAATTWKEMDDFHEVMAETFHPMEDGDFKPIRARAKEMADKAARWASSAVPADMTLPPNAKENLKKLAKESAALSKLIDKKAKDAAVKKALTALHDRFHEVSGQCKHK
jgi:hypothetical protein